MHEKTHPNHDSPEMRTLHYRTQSPLERTFSLECLHGPATRYTRTSEAPRALPPLGAFSTTLEPVLMGIACCAEPMVPF